MRPGSSTEAGAQPIHSLAFRVMRLCRPSIQIENPLKFFPEDLDPAHQEGDADDLADVPFKNRTNMTDTTEAFGIGGMMVLPQSFGTIYLGESFCSYISVGNYSDHAVSSVGIKAELQTERKRVVLFDNSASPLPVLPANGRHDFTVEHELKEIGAHTLVCSTVYTDADQE
eukprot:CAMPEP_0198224826 /NCGR_PEP_ID=MMETSP1445-20131203/98447_1 /TAXON_ID=36898 /ORGANISM="Pyramimonas sp., Strain CCMP2087" /LENGTH=170 /DNA_ID=CAMNT_0043904127 /DNA_START=250 /DNA_END=759 /DNA_ORIENTATION=+